MAKSIEQIKEDNARMEHAANTGASIATGLMVLFWIIIPLIVISFSVIASK